MPPAAVVDLETATRRRAELRRGGQKVVFTNGCFDLLHAGHVRLLEQARQQGDVLVVGVNSDRSVSTIKGPDRPLLSEDRRAAMLAALEPVDLVIVFSEPTPAALIEALVPDVLVKGADWPKDKVVGREVVEAAGGQVVSVDLMAGRSTSELLARIKRT